MGYAMEDPMQYAMGDPMGPWHIPWDIPRDIRWISHETSHGPWDIHGVFEI